MTISGAAASPNMGYHSSPAVSFVMTFFNVRLGWWLPNPKFSDDKLLQKREPESALKPLFFEATGQTTEERDWIYLSDGGHFDNLGLYEMIRRRCRKIVVVDASADEEQEYDEYYDDAIALVTKTGQASISMIQRHLRVGYNRAARMIEVMEKEGVVGPSDGVKPREVLVAGYDDRE